MTEFHLSEPLRDDRRYHQGRGGSRNGLVVLSLILLVICCGFPLFSMTATISTPRQHRHTQPTLLSVVDPETMEYLMVSEHPFYETWKNSLVRTSTSTTSDIGSLGLLLQLDKTQLHQVRDSLTVSWQAVDNVNEDDVLALY